MMAIKFLANPFQLQPQKNNIQKFIIERFILPNSRLLGSHPTSPAISQKANGSRETVYIYALQ